jgi:hypothetical protein
MHMELFGHIQDDPSVSRERIPAVAGHLQDRYVRSTVLVMFQDQVRVMTGKTITRIVKVTKNSLGDSLTFHLRQRLPVTPLVNV